MTNGDPALGMVGTAMTLMFGVAMIDYAHRSTKDLMKQGRGKGRNGNNFNVKHAPDFSPPNGKVPKFDPFKVEW